MSISFDRSTGLVTEMNSVFGWYFLIPFALAVLILLLEIGIVERLPRLRNGVVFCALALLPMALSFPSGDPTNAEFRTTFVETVASPLFITVQSLLVFFLYAWWRGVKVAEAGAMGMLILATIVEPRMVEFGPTNSPQVWPIAAVAIVQLALAIYRQSAVRGFATALSVTAVLTAMTWQSELLMYRVIVPTHTLLISMIGIGILCDGRFARFISGTAAVLLPPISVVTAYVLSTSLNTESTMLYYFGGISAFAFYHWYLTNDRRFLAAGLCNTAVGFGGGSWYGFQNLAGRLGPDVVQPLLYGTACFMVAASISAHKAGVFRRTATSREGPYSDEDPGQFVSG